MGAGRVKIQPILNNSVEWKRPESLTSARIRVILMYMRYLIPAILLLAVSCGPRIQPGLVDGYYRVSRVIDGDTIILTNVGPLRFADLDAPELEEPGGPEAKAVLAARIEGKAVFVTFRRRKSDGMPVRGYYGRLLGEIFSARP